jgi:hypothetical protein
MSPYSLPAWQTQGKDGMAKKTQKTIKRSTGDWMYCSFSVHPEEIAEYRDIAAKSDRSLSWWIRNELNKAVAVAKGQTNETLPVEVVSADGTGDHPDRG